MTPWGSGLLPGFSAGRQVLRASSWPSLQLSPSLALLQPHQPPHHWPGMASGPFTGCSLRRYAMPVARTLKHNKLPRWAGPRDCQARAGQLGGAKEGRCTYGNWNKEP